MLHFRYLFILFLFVLSSCEKSATEKYSLPAEAEDSVVAPIQNPDMEGDEDSTKLIYITKFNKTFLDFQTAVFNEDAAGVNQLIDPKHGLYIIENPGALPKMTLVKDIRSFKREFQNKTFFTIKDQLKSCELKEEALPTFNCDGTTDGNTGYSKEGCFAADAAEFRNNEIYKFASLPPNEVKAIEETLPLVAKTVVQTSSSFRFHFGYINHGWKLLFIDLRIPCSA